MNRSKACIFCGITGNMTKEHFWSEWLAPYLQFPPPHSHVSEFHKGEGKQSPRLVHRSERPGAINTKKIRVVCAACNNGWMSTLESQAKPILLSLFGDERSIIAKESIATLALWVAVKSLIGEYAMDGTALTPNTERLLLFRQHLIPRHIRIFVAYHSLSEQAIYYRQSATVSVSHSTVPPKLPNGISRNIQATTFLVGRLCFYVTGVCSNGISTAILDPVRPMYRLWPDPPSQIDFSRQLALKSADVAMIMYSLDRLVQRPDVKYGGPS